jgi:hypothetical protein
MLRSWFASLLQMVAVVGVLVAAWLFSVPAFILACSVCVGSLGVLIDPDL